MIDISRRNVIATMQRRKQVQRRFGLCRRQRIQLGKHGENQKMHQNAHWRALWPPRIGQKTKVRPAADSNGETVHVDRWVVTIQTSPGKPDLPSQKIKVEIANTNAYTKEPVALKSNCDFLEYPSQIIVPTESLSEVLADKIVAFSRSLFDQHGKPAQADSTLIRQKRAQLRLAKTPTVEDCAGVNPRQRCKDTQEKPVLGVLLSTPFEGHFRAQ